MKNFSILNELFAGGYLTKSSANPGAGDLLMGFLGSVILSFAFSMFRQRKVGRRLLLLGSLCLPPDGTCVSNLFGQSIDQINNACRWSKGMQPRY